ncbi:MAG: hypothetical protein ABIX37_05685 [Gammaproteobacteria bacterium]
MRIAAPLIVLLTLEACSASQVPTLAQYGESAIGLNISVIQELVRRPDSEARTIGWQEKSYALDNGHWVYVEPDRENCEIHYEVNADNIIVAYTAVGTGCVYQ